MGRSGYDYIIVGAGTAGCVLAARLTQHGARVLLLEAGTAARTPAMTDPARWPDLLGSAADWQYTTTPQAEAGPLPYPAGRTLGGSGSVNAMAHIRGHRAVYDQWPPGWHYGDLLPYFKASETIPAGSHAPPDDPYRGTSGPVRAAPVPPAARHPVASAFAAALGELGYPRSSDLSGHQQHGIGWPDLAITAGRRSGPAGAYLRPARTRPALTVRTSTRATRLIIDRGRCTGVTCRRGRTSTTVRAAEGVIVCAGAIGTPHLLLLSGIGPAAALTVAGITVVADLPVGEYLQDHPAVPVTYTTPGPVPRSRGNHGEMYAALHSTQAGAWPDLHLFPVLLPPGPGADGYSLLAAVVAPDSRGTIALNPAGPDGPPLINPGFFLATADLDRIAEGLSVIRAAAGTAPLAGLGTETRPGPGITGGAGLRGYIRRSAGSYWHPAGTCRLGTGGDSVTGPDLAVHGIDGLHVADASVIPLIPNAPLNATVLAIAEKAASLITGTRPAPAARPVQIGGTSEPGIPR